MWQFTIVSDNDSALIHISEQRLQKQILTHLNDNIIIISKNFAEFFFSKKSREIFLQHQFNNTVLDTIQQQGRVLGTIRHRFNYLFGSSGSISTLHQALISMNTERRLEQ
jgi:hypothetical protein